MKKAINLFIFLTTLLLFSCSNNKPSSNDIKPSSKDTTEKVSIPSEEVKQNEETNLDPQQIEYDTYVNTRFGYSISYPTFLTPQPEAYNSDGREFTKGDNEKITVYAMYNVMESTIQELKQMREKSIDGSVVYYAQKNNWYVLSGINSAGNIYYLKTILYNDTEYTVQLTYPQDKKEFYNEIIDKVISSFDVEWSVSAGN